MGYWGERSLATLVVVSMVFSGVSVLGFGLVGSAQAPGPANEAAWFPNYNKIDPDLVQTMAATPGDARVTAIVKVYWAPDLSSIQYQMEPVKAALKAESFATQAPVVAWLEGHNAVVMNQFWLTNVILASAQESTFLQLSSLPQVQSIFPNFEINAPVPTPGATVYPGWQLDNVNVKPVWEQLGITGAGVRAATTDTGVHLAHPDLVGKMATDNPADPTFPGGWIEINGAGQIVQGSVPHDTHGHGTATAGLVLGGAASGVSVGMAPTATLMHALVIPGGSGSFAQVIRGLEWVINPVDQYGNPAGAPARVSSHSWGAVGKFSQLIEPIRNMWFAGHVVVASIGNCGAGCSGSPGNVYEAVAAGATDVDHNVAGFSSGELINKNQWSNPPADWPETYIVPDLSAPGLNVYTPYPPNTYVYWSGTSFSSPLIGGMFTLMAAANPSLTPPEYLQVAIDGSVWSNKYSNSRPDIRLGWGEIDAFASVLPIAFKQGVRGRVTADDTGQALGQAKVEILELGRSVTTKADGSFELRIPDGTYTLKVTRFGYLDKTIANVVVPKLVFVPLNVALSPAPRGTVEGVVVFGPTQFGIPGILVDVLNIPVELAAETDFTGAFSIKLPVGTYTMKSRLTGFQCSTNTGIVVIKDTVTTSNFACTKALRVAVLGDFSGQIRNQLIGAGMAVEAMGWEVAAQASDFDLVVLGTFAGDPGSTTFNRLLSEANTGKTGIMFLDNWGGGFGSQSGIAMKSKYTGVPTFRSDHYYFYTPTFYYVFQPTHPIFAGLPTPVIWHKVKFPVGDTDHAWFWDFSNTLSILGYIGDYFGAYYLDGPGIATQQFGGSRHIYLSGHGPTFFSNFDHWSADSLQLFKNSATWAARSAAGAVFAVWDTVADGRWQLAPNPAEALWNVDTKVPLGVKNIGSAVGTATSRIAVAKNVEQTLVTTLGANAFKTLEFSLKHFVTDAKGIFVTHDVNPPGKVTSYDISVQHIGGAFKIRPPMVTTKAFTIDVPIDPIALQDAAVEILWKDDGRNPYATGKWNLITEGTIGKDGSLVFPSPRSREDYTVIVRHQNYGYLGPKHYLLTRPVVVEGDQTQAFAPTYENSAVVGLNFQQLDPNHEVNTWFRSPDTCPAAPAGCVIYAFPPGTLVATPSTYKLTSVFEWQTLDDRWAYPTIEESYDFRVARSYDYNIGGAIVTTLSDVREQQAPNLYIYWTVTDSFYHRVASIARTLTGEFPAKSLFGTDSVVDAVAAAPQATVVNPTLALFSPGGKILRTGSFPWADQTKFITYAPAGAGVSPILLRVNTGPWGGMMSSTAKLIVPARTITGYLTFPGDTFEVKVTFDSPMKGDTAVGLEELVPKGFSLVSFTASKKPTDSAGPAWAWKVGDYASGEVITVTYKLRVAADTVPGDYAIAGSVQTGTQTKRTTAGMSLVRVIPRPDGAVLGAIYEVSGDALEGARVDLVSGGTVVGSAITDVWGHYMIQAPQGAYTIRVSKAGYETSTVSESIVWGQPSRLTIRDDWVVDGKVYWAPMPLKPTLMYVLRVLDRWTDAELRTETVAHLLDNWKS